MGKKMLFPDGRSKMSRNLKKESWGFIDFNKPKKKKEKNVDSDEESTSGSFFPWWTGIPFLIWGFQLFFAICSMGFMMLKTIYAIISLIVPEIKKLLKKK